MLFGAIYGSKVINVFLTKEESLIMFFFLGIVLTSFIQLYKNLDGHTLKNFFFGIFGFLIGTSFLFFNFAKDSSVGDVDMFISGFLAVIAALFPGISGAYLLLYLGTYSN